MNTKHLMFGLVGVGVALSLLTATALPRRDAPGPGHIPIPTPNSGMLPQPDPDTDACATTATNLPTPKLVTFPGPGVLTLHGYLYVPSGPGPFPAMIWNHGSEHMDRPGAGEQQELAKFYVKHGFVFFMPHRHGQGRSMEAGDYIVDLQNLMSSPEIDRSATDEFDTKIHDWYNQDVLAAVSWLKKQPSVDPHRIAMSGCSYGGIQTVLTAQQNPGGVRAYVPFSPGAMSWASPTIRTRLSQAVRRAKAPIFIVQARGDFSYPILTLGPIITAKGGLNKSKLYPQYGTTNEEAHGCFATKGGGIDVWGTDVIHFLNTAMK
ncbi:hypothetical protein IAD21_04497 [Abditibacteriota bacterium]|nr:hypothetical protein IAD21_04497 [Abditibacteriota bacterium]